MALNQAVALVMMNKCAKFEVDSFNSMEVLDKVNLNFADDADAHADADAHDSETAMMTARVFL